MDGKVDDWDLSAGIFACDEMEEQREHFGVWRHAQYDVENLYMLARWIDETPLNSPGQSIADDGFAGDSLQFRTLTAAGMSQERGQHFTGWRRHDGADVVKVEQARISRKAPMWRVAKRSAEESDSIAGELIF